MYLLVSLMKKIIFTRQNSYTDSRWWQFSIKKKQYFEFFYAHCPEFAGISPTDLIQKLPYASEKYILLFFFPTKRSLELTENINLLIANANVKKKSLFSFVYSTYEITWYVLKALFQNFLDIYIYKKKINGVFHKNKIVLDKLICSVYYHFMRVLNKVVSGKKGEKCVCSPILHRIVNFKT